MLFHKPIPVKSFKQLRDRVDDFFATNTRQVKPKNQLSLDLPDNNDLFDDFDTPKQSATEFINFLSDALPVSDIYLFGGMLRDIALFGKRGFNSDIDLVVDGDWLSCTPYLEHAGAKKNKFGGYRLTISGQLIDIWNARETWAIKNGYVHYDGIKSLTDTTVLNWDAILMNWRTKNFICNDNYIDELKDRKLNIVLEPNPNPKGMAVRVFRHLCLKYTNKISAKAAEYLASCTIKFSFDELIESEKKSYGDSVIEFATFRLFERLNFYQDLKTYEKYSAASEYVKNEGLTLSSHQLECNFGERRAGTD